MIKQDPNNSIIYLISDYADGIHAACLLRSCFKKWKAQYQHYNNVKLLETQIKTLGQKALKRRSLILWKNCML